MACDIGLMACDPRCIGVLCSSNSSEESVKRLDFDSSPNLLPAVAVRCFHVAPRKVGLGRVHSSGLVAGALVLLAAGCGSHSVED